MNIPTATGTTIYQIDGKEGWWKKVTKQEAKGDINAVKALYGNESLGFFMPFDPSLREPATKKVN